MLARERVEALIDAGSTLLELGSFAAWGLYEEWGGAPAAGVVVGLGRVSGRECVLVSNDATVKAGAWFPMTCKKILRAQEIALENRLPIIYLVDSAGVFLPMQDEIFPDREHFGRVFYNNARLSAEGIYQIAAIIGSCVAGGAYLPIMSDEALIVEGTGTIFLAGAHLVQAAIGEKIDNQALGGAEVQVDISGVVDDRFAEDARRLDHIRARIGELAHAPTGAVRPHRAPAAGGRSRRAARHPAGRPDATLRHPRAAGSAARRLRVRRVQGDLRQDACLRHRSDRRLGGGRRRQPAPDRAAPTRPRSHRPGDADRRRDLLRRRRQGGAVRRADEPEGDSAALPPGRHRLHGRLEVGARRDHQGRRQDGQRGGQLGGARRSPSSSATRSAPATTRCAARPTGRGSSSPGRRPRSR